MTRQHDRFIERSTFDQLAHAEHRPSKKPVLPAAGARKAGGRFSMLGMAIGYLGLVALLSMAPFFHLALTPYQSHPVACTDFGGSR